MKGLLAKSFGTQLHELSESLSANWAWPSPEAGFVTHVFTTAGKQLSLMRNEVLPSSFDRRRMAEAPVLAAIGFRLAQAQDGIDAALLSEWADSFSRLVCRKPFTPDRESFFYRPLELLGLTLGIVNCSVVKGEDSKRFIETLTAGENKLSGSEPWSFYLGAYAAHLLGCSWKPRPLPELDGIALEEIALLKWLCLANRPFAERWAIAKEENNIEKALLERCATASHLPVEAPRAAVLQIALGEVVHRILESEHERNWQTGRDSKDAVAVVSSILGRFHLFARQCGIRYDNRNPFSVNDEYDVQDLLHALLKLHFDDVRSEEWTPSYAGKSSRTDFLLKKEQIVIEAKMTRKKLGQKEVADELIIDKERYKAHPDCKILICFVYDPEGKCPNPTALEKDLAEDTLTPKVLVIVAPKGV